jgi:hypothetical protein
MTDLTTDRLGQPSALSDAPARQPWRGKEKRERRQPPPPTATVPSEPAEASDEPPHQLDRLA